MQEGRGNKAYGSDFDVMRRAEFSASLDIFFNHCEELSWIDLWLDFLALLQRPLTGRARH